MKGTCELTLKVVVLLDMAMRIVFFILRKLILVIVAVFLIGITFFAARDIANIYIVINEGLEKRASVILGQNIDSEFLNRFFSERFLNEDNMLNNNIFEEFNVYDYRMRIRIATFLVMPWDNSAQISVEEVVFNIMGEPRNSEGGLAKPPAWENGKKEIILLREEGRWQINSIVLKEPIAIVD